MYKKMQIDQNKIEQVIQVHIYIYFERKRGKQ